MSTEQQRRPQRVHPGAGIADQVARAAIATLKRQRFGLSGAGPGSMSVWQEFALQVQGEPSAFWDAYVIHVQQVIEGAIVTLPEADQRALSLRTADGRAWAVTEGAEGNPEPPVFMDAMTTLLYDRLHQAAMDDEDNAVANAQCQAREPFDDEGGSTLGVQDA
jgi:hypothetical protein